jgi:hypothetical protein
MLGLAMSLPAGRADGDVMGLVGYWPGDGDTNDIVGPNSGTLVNGVTFALGLFGQACSSNANSYVQAPTIGLPTGGQDRTLALGFNINSYSATVEEAWLAGYGRFGDVDSACGTCGGEPGLRLLVSPIRGLRPHVSGAV